MVADCKQGSSDAELEAIDRSRYREPLKELKQVAEEIPNTPLLAKQKINTLVLLNMQWESIMKDRNLSSHPFDLTAGFIQNAIETLKAWHSVQFIENQDELSLEEKKEADMENKHHDLFQDLWVNFSEDEYIDRIERYVHRLKLNNLFDGFLQGRDCVDLGCGHGNFAHALLKAGANSVVGVDYGENSIAYANKAKERLAEERLEYLHASVYELPFEENRFDFAVQNGVFHHLEDEDKALSEASRVLKKGAHMWYYTSGAHGVSFDLWDTSVFILRDVPHHMITAHSRYLNANTGKQYHLGDALNATYRRTTWDEITARLSRHGFGNFKRLVGGYDTDFDHDVIAEDKYGIEKFGSGDLRILVEKIS